MPRSPVIDWYSLLRLRSWLRAVASCCSRVCDLRNQLSERGDIDHRELRLRGRSPGEESADASPNHVCRFDMTSSSFRTMKPGP